MHCTALFPVVHLAVLAPCQTTRLSVSLRLSGRQKPLEPGPAGSSEQRGGRGCNADGREGEALPAAFPRGARGAWSCCIHAGARRAGGRSECLAEAAERRSHRRAEERWERRAAGASVSRGETQHLGAEQLHGAPQAGPAPRSPPLGAGGPRRLPPRCAALRPLRPTPLPPQAGTGPAGGGRAERVGMTTLPSRPRCGRRRLCSRGQLGVVVLSLVER